MSFLSLLATSFVLKVHSLFPISDLQLIEKQAELFSFQTDRVSSLSPKCKDLPLFILDAVGVDVFCEFKSS